MTELIKMHRIAIAAVLRQVKSRPAYTAGIAAMAALLAGGLSALADEGAANSKSALMEEALSAAPPQVAETATVMDLEGNLLREGTGAYTCFPAPPGIAGPMCMDEQWMAWMDAWMKKEPPATSAIGLAYMLAGDASDGGASNIDPFATTPTADNQWVVEGPHVMIIVPDEALLAGLPTTPDTDGPYVMWPGTPYAHVMWPVDERGAQRLLP